MEHKLEVWKHAHALTLAVYKLTEVFPTTEQFGLVNQMRRSVSSIPSNIVEGHARQSRKEYIRFLYIAKGSAEETHYHLFLSKELGYISQEQYDEVEAVCVRVKMMLNKLISALSEKNAPS